ncbi:MAG TPA: RNA methyltransferase [Thermoanaerobaculia bacterium]|nr:RNA methyltransferase [Thermoanaerobaculia bacterium]
MIRIVLVEPQEAGNVGAAARVMKNFGHRDLWIAGEHPNLHPLAGWWASGADDVVQSAHFVPTLAEALADAHVTIATTSMRGRTTPVDLTPRDVAAIASILASDQTLALVFGRENSGLTRDEVVMCQQTCSVPTDKEFPTMNLAQTVGIFCYELSSIVPSSTPRELAPAGLVERLHRRAEELLLEVGFLHANNPDRIYDDVRAMAGRADLDAREVKILLGMIRQIEWKVKK